jgi:hypothetical protein
MIMSGLFERIARRRATPPDENREHDASAIAASTSPGGEPAQPDAPAAAGAEEPVAGADQDAPTVQSDAVDPPAEQDAPTVQADAVAPPPEVPETPSFRERGKVRRRLRYLRRVRELQLRDLGGLVFELRRFGREREDLVAEKLTQLAATDDELRGLETVLGDRRALVELREPGVGGTCPNCGALHGSADHFCAHCGRPLREDGAATPAEPAATVEQPNGVAPDASAEGSAPEGTHVAAG